MDYSQARENIATGDLLFFRGRLLHSWLIQFWTRSVYSHVGIAVWIQLGNVRRLCVLEAMEGRGVRLYPLSHYLKSGELVDWFAITDASIDRQQLAGWAIGHLGRRYASPLQFVRSFTLITKRFCDWLRIPTKVDKDRFFCSCFAAQALIAGGWQPDNDMTVDPSLAPPGEVSLYPCLQRRGPISMKEHRS